ncbi:PKD domain-containing protein [Streptomyces sp. NRRL S-241]|uniref:PKD domain-containing protein n=1 Tax=Streptomyces sp. NRRL S-241 TaxID=1463896 RepID=UPI00055BC3EA|nr:PKD domain-containing protein [Streptomyces sp. NRRL S-241]
MAQAAGPSADGAHGITSSKDLLKTAASAFTFSSPADRSVQQNRPAAGKKAAAAPQASGATAGADLKVGLSGTGTSARAIELKSDITSSVGTPLTVVIDWGDGTASTEHAGGSETKTSHHVYAEVGSYTVKVTVYGVDGANGPSATNEMPFVTPGSEFTPHSPTRLLDSRDGTGAAQAAQVPALGEARVKVAGNGGIPADVAAVVLNVTVTNTRSSGYVSAYADGTERPTTSNVNYAAGDSVPNLVIVPVGKNGYVNLYNYGERGVDLIADVTGYFTRSSANGYTPTDPTRFVDTREGLGTSRGMVPGRGQFGVQVAGTRGIPAGAKAVALNVTVTNPRTAGYLTVFPGGQSAPNTSNVNFTSGQTIANSVIVPVGADGKIMVRNGSWDPADVVVDVVGYYSPDSQSAYIPVRPVRDLDTRDASQWPSGPLKAGRYLYSTYGEENPTATAMVLNTTVTNTASAGYLTVSPDPNALWQYQNKTHTPPIPPNSSTLNWTAGKTVPNLVQASSGANGIVDFFNRSGNNIDLVIDIFGVYDRH